MTSVLITGANRGIGLEFAKEYANEGARVFACARVPGKAKELLAIAAASKGKVTVHPLDVTSAASVAHLKSEIGDAPIDILINNAGVYGGDHQSDGDFDFDEWTQTLAVNTVGPVRVIDAFKANVAKSQAKKMIAITSGMGSTPRHDGKAIFYRSSKAGLNNAIYGLSLAYKKEGIIVVPVHPGWVQTDMGGKNASLTPSESVTALRKLIAGLKPSDSGRYLSFDGSEFSW